MLLFAFIPKILLDPLLVVNLWSNAVLPVSWCCAEAARCCSSGR